MDESSAHQTRVAALRLLGTSDVHMHLTGWDARTDDTDRNRGLARLANVIAAARASAPGACVLLDNGDALQGTPAADIAMEPDMRADHPWPKLLDALGYTAVGLGNHDFDYGLGPLAEICAQSPCPVLSASPDRPLSHVVSHTVINVPLVASAPPLRLGLTSVLPPQTVVWNHGVLSGQIDFAPGVAAARAAVTALRPLSDVIVLLCHSGIGPDGSEENFARTVGQQVPGIDAMILGHTHERFPTRQGETLAGVPAVMPGFAADCLGQIDLTLAHNANGWHVTAHNSKLLHATDAAPSATITQISAPCLARTRDVTEEIVGTALDPLHSYFAMVQSGGVDALVAQAMRDTVAHAAPEEYSDVPILAAVAPLAAGGRAGPRNYVDIPTGPLRRRHVTMISPYLNSVWAQRMTGTTLRRYAETSAAFFDAGNDARKDTLVSSHSPAFNFDMLHGLETTIDPSAPTGARIRSLRYDGQDLRDDDLFLVAMTSYRAAGGGGFPGTGPDAAVQTDIALSDALVMTLGAANAGVQPSVWQFAPDLHQRVTIETSPRAEAHLDDIARFDPEPMGLTSAGFLK
ncbi:MAG: 5'-nucleotidase C-terminal domain-containing protein, partial [Pseudomonadota bacterium]